MARACRQRWRIAGGWRAGADGATPTGPVHGSVPARSRAHRPWTVPARPARGWRGSHRMPVGYEVASDRGVPPGGRIRRDCAGAGRCAIAAVVRARAPRWSAWARRRARTRDATGRPRRRGRRVAGATPAGDRSRRRGGDGRRCPGERSGRGADGGSAGRSVIAIPHPAERLAGKAPWMLPGAHGDNATPGPVRPDRMLPTPHAGRA